MNPESQSGGAADKPEAPKPTETTPQQAMNQPIAPQATEIATKLPEPQMPAQSAPQDAVPEEQHFFRADAQSPAPVMASDTSFSPASNQLNPRMLGDGEEVDWNGPEFIYHAKNIDWYLTLGIVSVVIIGIVALMTRSIWLSITAAVMCTIFGVSAARKPRDMDYAVDGHGVSIGRSFHAYSDFRAFSITPEADMLNLTFIPLKRFMPPMSVYLDPADQDRVAKVIAEHLPLEAHQPDALERLMRRIRF